MPRDIERRRGKFFADSQSPLEKTVIDGAVALVDFGGRARRKNFSQIFVADLLKNFGRDFQRRFVKFAERCRLPNAFAEIVNQPERFARVAAECLIKRPHQQQQSRQPLLTVDDFVASVAVAKRDDDAQKVFVAFVVEGFYVVVGQGEIAKIVPQRLTFVFRPGVSALVIGNQKIFFDAREQLLNSSALRVNMQRYTDKLSPSHSGDFF